jgi:hypothetical protein
MWGLCSARARALYTLNYVAQVKVHLELARAAFGLTGAVLECIGTALRLHRGAPPSVPELHLGHVGSMFSARARAALYTLTSRRSGCTWNLQVLHLD